MSSTDKPHIADIMTMEDLRNYCDWYRKNVKNVAWIRLWGHEMSNWYYNIRETK